MCHSTSATKPFRMSVQDKMYASAVRVDISATPQHSLVAVRTRPKADGPIACASCQIKTRNAYYHQMCHDFHALCAVCVRSQFCAGCYEKTRPGGPPDDLCQFDYTLDAALVDMYICANPLCIGRPSSHLRGFYAGECTSGIHALCLDCTWIHDDDWCPGCHNSKPTNIAYDRPQEVTERMYSMFAELEEELDESRKSIRDHRCPVDESGAKRARLEQLTSDLLQDAEEEESDAAPENAEGSLVRTTPDPEEKVSNDAPSSPDLSAPPAPRPVKRSRSRVNVPSARSLMAQLEGEAGDETAVGSGVQVVPVPAPASSPPQTRRRRFGDRTALSLPIRRRPPMPQ
jgi:hypothetical protein